MDIIFTVKKILLRTNRNRRPRGWSCGRLVFINSKIACTVDTQNWKQRRVFAIARIHGLAAGWELVKCAQLICHFLY